VPFSLEDKHIIVTYHYVENPREDRGGIHPCPVDEFERQVTFLSQNYSLTSLEEVFKGAQEESEERLCALTFDDGLQGQYENAIPILQKHKAGASFFIITGTFDGNVPFAHKLHILFSSVPKEELTEKYHQFLLEFFPEKKNQFRIPVDKYLNDARRHDDIRIANFKEIVALLPQEIKEKFFIWMFEELGLDERMLAREFFMNESEVKHVSSLGYTIGSHGKHHKAFDQLTEREIRDEVSLSKKRLMALSNQPILSFCYPYGRLSKNTDVALGVLRGEGFKYGVTIERRAVGSTDNPLLLPRYDTNNIRDFLSSH